MIELEKYASGHWEKGLGGYRYFVPTPINEQWHWDSPEINALLEKAAIKLGELNAYARLVPNVELFLQLHVVKEAVISSRIEGTQTGISEALLEESEISPERRNDWKEVNNYIRALNTAIDELNRLPISSRLIKATHAILLDNARGEHKLPGQYRTSQNWIGGSGPADAVFVPPHHQFVEALMGDLEFFLHNDDITVPDLIRIAIAHYQFETIHPFLDGNGRIGRLMITLFLMEKKILEKPLLYLSGFFEKNKSLYYDNLTFVRTKNDMTQWLKYFLAGITQTAQLAMDTLAKVLDLRLKIEKQIHLSFGRKGASANILLQYLFQKPIVQVQEVSAFCQLSYKTANHLIADFVEAGILQEMTGQTRNRLFVFQEYLSLF
jgi:Fic family protein